jgi:Predicted AAA-ATPase/PD-(D/E)XK nuclease superfamily
MERKKLPIGIQNFQDFHNENYLYIDKTQWVYQMLTTGKNYFLSRPRRFGKSLLLSTLKEVFQGRKELFEGLWIEDKWDFTKTYPVVHISLGATGFKEIGLSRALYSIINESAEQHGIILTEDGNPRRFQELLRKLYAKKGAVVVLIDEYDKPIVDCLDNTELAHINRDILHDFYIVLKENPTFLQFIFITGISKFSKVSIFSALSHLSDLSMNDNYATMLGYTQEELETYFAPYMPQALTKQNFTQQELLDKLKFWYDGYTWDGMTRMYNPFSIVNFFNECRFKNYWFSTGTPTFLTIMARQQKFYDMDATEVEQSAFDTFDVDNLNAPAIMFQTGYLTIKKHDTARERFTLGYPNNEVRKAFLTFMIEAYSFVQVNDTSPWAIRLEKAFYRRDLQEVMSLMNTMFANIPSHIFDKDSERYYHSLMHLLLHYLGTFIQSEVNTNNGRIDSVIHTPDHIYVMEYKLNKTAQEALNYLYKQQYLVPYLHTEKELIAVGIGFSSATKQIAEWKAKVIVKRVNPRGTRIKKIIRIS